MERQRVSVIFIPEHFVDVIKQYEIELREILLSKYGCGVTLEGVEREMSPVAGKPPPATQDKRWEITLDSGVRVSVWKADLTRFKVDAVVNAANEQLNHFGGLADALSTAGGPLIQRESYDYIQRHGPVRTGDAIVTGSGSLPCLKLIHAVGPRVSRQLDLKKAEPLLEKTIISILNVAKAQQLSTVAIPAISSGIFCYPLPQCADTIVKTVRRFYQNAVSQAEIRLVNHDEASVREMERACKQFLTTGRAAHSLTYTPANRNAPPPKHQVVMEHVVLTLKKDLIEEQQTDVIVNTTSEHRDLHAGVISRAILKKAGDKLQKEMYSASKQGNIFVTGPHKMNCKALFHTFCVDKTSPRATEKLGDAVKECLWMTLTAKHTSIAFPAIGTGNLGFTGQEVASIMTKEVVKFNNLIKNSPNPGLPKIDVDFIIYPKDQDTFKAFEQELGTLQSGERPHSLNGPMEAEESHYRANGPPSPRDSEHRGGAPCLRLRAPSSESIEEGEKWLRGLFKAPERVNIHNNLVQKLSFEEHQRFFNLGLGTLEEFSSQGHAGVGVEGFSPTEMLRVVLRVEEMLCKVQKEFVSEEMREMEVLTNKKTTFERKAVDKSSQEYRGIRYEFPQDLHVVKVEQVVNKTLQNMFDLKKKQLHCNKPRRMYQRIPAQFCDIISQIGFHVELAPPEDPKYGDGIYFTNNPSVAMRVWRQTEDQYLYFVEAEVLTGDSTAGGRGLILPPKRSGGLYDSVDGGSKDVSVIFSGYQALPLFIITCEPPPGPGRSLSGS